jgi:hypothetical protein
MNSTNHTACHHAVFFSPMSLAEWPHEDWGQTDTGNIKMKLMHIQFGDVDATEVAQDQPHGRP